MEQKGKLSEKIVQESRSELQTKDQNVTNGFVYTFGCGSQGALGTNYFEDKPTPYLLSTFRDGNVIKVSCGGGHTTALTKQGQLYIWGDSRRSSAPKLMSEFQGKRVSNVSCGYLHTMAVVEGELYVWGDDLQQRNQSPRLIKSIKVKDIDSGSLCTFILTESAHLYQWTIGKEDKLVQIAGPDLEICKISSGGTHTLLLNKKGQVYSFGSNCKNGQLGLGSSVESVESPTLIKNVSDIVSIACGDKHSLLVNKTGQVFSFGDGKYGQLGHGDRESCDVPREIKGIENIVQVVAGGSHSVAINEQGQIFTFGGGTYGQLGHGGTSDSLLPKRIVYMPGYVISASCGWLHTAVIVRDPPADEQYDVKQAKYALGCFQEIPKEIVRTILEFMDVRELCRISQTSSQFNKFANDPHYWELIGKAKFNIPMSATKADIMQRWYRESPKYFTANKLAPVPTTGIKSLFNKVFSKYKNYNIIMVGLNNAGKTTTLYKLKLGEVVTTIPSTFNIEEIQYKKCNMKIWDLGGAAQLRPLWPFYIQNLQAMIFMVDSNDRDRIAEASDELHKMLGFVELKDVPVLVWANKQDLPNAMSVSEVTDRLGLYALRNRQWYIQACCAPTGDGLYEGIDWLTYAFASRKQ